MNINKKVTVCIPTYNRANTISNSIKSILNQTYTNIEILIIDNASTDKTKEVVEKFDDSRINYLYFDKLLDVNYNFMRAIRHAKTEIVCLFHSDDYYFPNIIEEQIKYILKPNVGAVFSKMIRKDINEINNEEITFSKKIYHENEIITYNYKSFLNKALNEGIPVACPTFMTKKSVVKEVGILEKKEGLISDISLWLPIVKNYNIVDLQMPLMYYGVSKEQLSFKIHNDRKKLSPQFKVLDSEVYDHKNMISKETLRRYKYRKFKDYMHISKNNFLDKNFKNMIKYIIEGFFNLFKK